MGGAPIVLSGLTSPRKEITDDGVHTLNDDLIRMTRQIMEIGP
jgi:hypothetical protein